MNNELPRNIVCSAASLPTMQGLTLGLSFSKFWLRILRFRPKQNNNYQNIKRKNDCDSNIKRSHRLEKSWSGGHVPLDHFPCLTSNMGLQTHETWLRCVHNQHQQKDDLRR